MSNQNEHNELFMEMYLPVKRDISNYCRILTSNADIARDLLQDTLLAAYEGIHTLRKHESFLFYLCGIARRIYFKQLRRNKFQANNSHIEAYNYSSREDGETQMDIQILQRALSQIPEEQREALVLFEIIGFSLEEIKVIQKCSLSGVKSRIVRARQKLAAMLTDKETHKPEIETIKNYKL